MPVTWKDVFSSHVGRVGYDDETGEMLVEWKSGKVSGYAGVSADMVDDIAKSYSVGDRLNNEIKPAFPHRYR